MGVGVNRLFLWLACDEVAKASLAFFREMGEGASTKPFEVFCGLIFQFGAQQVGNLQRGAASQGKQQIDKIGA